MTIHLRGVSWDHPRGHAPLVGASEVWARRHPDLRIEWTARSLQEFADYPLEVLADSYDLLIVDHPHMPHAAREGYLLALDGRGHDADLEVLAEQSVGGSHGSYWHAGHQWALAVDAAAQVSIHRPDLLTDVPTTWDEVVEFAKTKRMLWPAKPVDAISSFLTIAANRGTPAAESEAEFIDPAAGLAVLELMHQLAAHVPSWCMTANPIQVADAMATSDEFCYAPLAFGYTNYSRVGFRPHRLRYRDIPSAGNGPRGSCLGGAGIAVSASSAQTDASVDFAFWLAGAECQSGVYYTAGGQPGNLAAWRDSRTNTDSLNFFEGTLASLQQSWIRPRYDEWLRVQSEAGDAVAAALCGETTDEEAVRRMNESYLRSLDAAALR